MDGAQFIEAATGGDDLGENFVRGLGGSGT
jgi:hypothetical protein